MKNWVSKGSIRVDLVSYACAVALLWGAGNAPSFAQSNMDW